MVVLWRGAISYEQGTPVERGLLRRLLGKNGRRRVQGSRAQRATWKKEARAVPSAFVGEGAALCLAKGVSAATGRESSRETVGS